ncbi:MAG: hypothetical protein M1608_14075 [Candidatus Omnitrophica bacterium]|nr:hypothetical protein [Candidatus Omnitrophota bacterium]
MRTAKRPILLLVFIVATVSAGGIALGENKTVSRRTDIHLFGGDLSPDAPLASWYHRLGITDVWLYPLKGAFPQDQRSDTQRTVEQLEHDGVLAAYQHNAIRYWWFERPVPDYAYETEKRRNAPGIQLWDNAPETQDFWRGVCESATVIYAQARSAGFEGLVFDGEAYYSYKGDESGKTKPWVWGGHGDQYGLQGNYYKRGRQVGEAIQSVWPGAKIVMVYAFGYPGERWWYQGFKDAGLELFLGAEHTYGAGPAKPGGQWYQSWWLGKKTKATCDWKRTQFPFIHDNQHVIAGVAPIDFGAHTPNYRAQDFREQVDSAANGDPAGPIPVWIWPGGPFSPQSWKETDFADGNAAQDYIRVLHDYSRAFDPAKAQPTGKAPDRR